MRECGAHGELFRRHVGTVLHVDAVGDVTAENSVIYIHASRTKHVVLSHEGDRHDAIVAFFAEKSDQLPS